MTRGSMTSGGQVCDRFEREGLLCLERGETLDAELDEHIQTCSDCVATRRAYEDLAARLQEPASAADSEHMEPPGDWQARVFAGIARRESGRRRRRLWAWVAVPALAALLLVAAYRWWAPGTDSPPSGAVSSVIASAEVETTILRGEVVRRGLDAQPGDRLRLEAGGGSLAVQELRIYANDRSVMARCGRAEHAARSMLPECAAIGDRLALEVEMTNRGRYQGMAILADVPGGSSGVLGAPTGEGIDADAGAAIAAGYEVQLGDRVDVR